jgi:hypothetical protein
MPEDSFPDLSITQNENSNIPELIYISPNGGYLAGSLFTLKEHGHAEFEEKVRQTPLGGSSTLTDEEVKVIEEILEPEHQFSSFMIGYAEARWGGRATAFDRGNDGKYHQENIAARFWWGMTPEERNNFYLRMSPEEAESFWNSNKNKNGAPVEIKVNKDFERTN